MYSPARVQNATTVKLSMKNLGQKGVAVDSFVAQKGTQEAEVSIIHRTFICLPVAICHFASLSERCAAAWLHAQRIWGINKLQ